jgi:phage FluMu gp28-like protein
MSELLAPENEDVLLPYQKQWIADDAQVKIAEKSRRTGLTWAEAADASLTASAARSAGGCNHFYVGSNKEMAREFIDAAAMWAKAFNRAASEVQEEIFRDEDGTKEILTFVINFPSSGFKIQALSSRPSNLRGMQGNVTIDEAAFHEALAELLKAALALTMWGSKVRIISTHNGADNLFNELIEDCRAGKKNYSLHRITLDDACSRGLYKRICFVNQQRFSNDRIEFSKWAWSIDKELAWKDQLLNDTASMEDALEEYGCVPKQGGGAYLSRSLIESCMVTKPVLRFEGSAEFNSKPEPLRAKEIDDWCKEHLLPLLNMLDPKQSHGFGEDFARTGDLTVFVPIALTQQLHRDVPFIVELKNVPFKQQEQILFYIVDRLPRLIAGKLDARGNGQYLAEQAVERYGADRIEAVMLSQSWYLNNMPKLKAVIEDAEISIPKDSDVLDDLRAVQVIKGIPKVPDGNTSSKKNKQRHGDTAIALCLANAATYEDPMEYAYEKVSAPKADEDIQDFIESGNGFGRLNGSLL